MHLVMRTAALPIARTLPTIGNAAFQGICPAMKLPYRLVVSCLLLSGLAACGCVDEAVYALPSPDGTLKAELRHCGCSLTTYRRTQVTVLESSRKAECMASTGVAGFDAPLDHTPLTLQWLSDDTLHARYPGYPDFPQTQYTAGDPARKTVTLVFGDAAPAP